MGHIMFQLNVGLLAETRARRVQAQLTEVELQLFIGEWVARLTDGIAKITLDEGVVTTKIYGDCAELRAPLERTINGLMEHMAIRFSIPFQLVQMDCGLSVVLAPSPPPRHRAHRHNGHYHHHHHLCRRHHLRRHHNLQARCHPRPCLPHH